MVTKSGTNYADTIYGGSGSDYLYGKGGNDLIMGKGGNDVIYGGDGNDTIRAGSGSDRVIMGDGSDRYYEDYGHDTIIGGAGSDRYIFDNGIADHNEIHDASGTDYIFFRGFSADEATTLGTFYAVDMNGNGKWDALYYETIDQHDSLLIYNYFNDSSAVVNQNHPGTGVIENIVCSDMTLHFSDIIALF